MEKEIIESAIKNVKSKFELLGQWNVGADTSDERFVNDVAEESLNMLKEKVNEVVQKIEWSDYECVGGNLTNNVEYIKLKEILK